MLLLKKQVSLNVSGYTVIIPSICVGNAAQLAVDLLISSKELRRIGNFKHAAFIPLYGPSAFQHEPAEHISACEIYESSEDKLIVIQFRTPLISRHAETFHDELAKLFVGAERVIILSGSFSFEKREIGGSPYEYCASKLFKDKNVKEMELMKWNEFTGDVVFGGGNCMQLYRKFELNEVPVMLLFRYLLDGDNTTDAASIIRELNELCEGFLKLTGKDGSLKLAIPVSWKLLFGNDVTEAIF